MRKEEVILLHHREAEREYFCITSSMSLVCGPRTSAIPSNRTSAVGILGLPGTHMLEAHVMHTHTHTYIHTCHLISYVLYLKNLLSNFLLFYLLLEVLQHWVSEGTG